MVSYFIPLIFLFDSVCPHIFRRITCNTIVVLQSILTVRTALLNGLHCLATAIGMGSMHVVKRIGHGSGADTAKGNQSKIQRENSLIVPADF